MNFVPSFVKRMLSTDLKYLLFSSIVIADKSEHPENALSPISLTFLGMLIDVSLKQKKYSSHNWCDTFWNGDEDKGEREWNQRSSIGNDFFTISIFSICPHIEDQWIVIDCPLLLHNLLFPSLPLINSVLFFLSKIYSELSPQELSIYLFFIAFFADSHLMFFNWFNIFKLHNKDSGTRSRVTKVGKEFIVFIFIFIFWMNLSVSLYLCFIVIVWMLFRHFIEMNWLESVLYLSCGYFHEWQQIDVRIIWLVEVRWQSLFESAFRHHGTVWWYQCLMWQQMW